MDLQYYKYVNCFYCTTPLSKPKNNGHILPTDFTIDHIIPKSKGGTRANGNTVKACSRCNNIKGCFTPLEFINVIREKLIKMDRSNKVNIIWNKKLISRAELLIIIVNASKLLK